MGGGVWRVFVLVPVVEGVFEKAANVLSSGENCSYINTVTCLNTHVGKVKTPIENVPLESAHL